METAVEENDVVTIKLVGASTYVCQAIPGGKISRGETAELTDKLVAESLLSETYTDSRGNTRRMFLLVAGAVRQEEEEGNEDLVEDDLPDETKVEAKTVRRTATRTARTTK